jgi:hypothetical protein
LGILASLKIYEFEPNQAYPELTVLCRFFDGTPRFFDLPSPLKTQNQRAMSYILRVFKRERFFDVPQNFKNPEPKVLRFVTKFQKNPEPKVLSFAEKKTQKPRTRNYNKIKEPAGQQHG